jgi:hypothetical protein
MGTRQTFSQQNISAQHSFSAQPNIHCLTLTASPIHPDPPSPPHVPQSAHAHRPRPSRPAPRRPRADTHRRSAAAWSPRRTPPPGHRPDANRRPAAAPRPPPSDNRPPLCTTHVTRLWYGNVFIMLYPWVTRYPPDTRWAQGRARNFTHGHGDG